MTHTARARQVTKVQNPIYDETFNRELAASNILNPNPDEKPSVHTEIWDKRNIEANVRIFEGTENGFYYKNGEKLRCYLGSIEDILTDIDKKFEDWKQERINLGYEPSETMPENLLNLKDTWRAKYEVRILELGRLRQMLKSFTDSETEKEDENMLRFGMICSCKLEGGVVKRIDGQPVISKTIDKNQSILIISRGPFAGLSVVAYRKLAEIWKADQEVKAQEELKKIQERQAQLGLPISQSPPSTFGMRVALESLPKFPPDEINYLQEKVNEDVAKDIS
jgi:hypothetical protein